MGAPSATDPVEDFVYAFETAMKRAFNPKDAVAPPLGGGSTEVRFFTGENALATWDAVSLGGGEDNRDCDAPFLWVSFLRRFRTTAEAFPSPVALTAKCDAPRVAVIEIGVGRCATLGVEVEWAEYDRQHRISLSDSYRIELALQMATCEIRSFDGGKHRTATDTVAQYGPEGGVVAWTGIAYIEF